MPYLLKGARFTVCIYNSPEKQECWVASKCLCQEHLAEYLIFFKEMALCSIAGCVCGITVLIKVALVASDISSGLGLLPALNPGLGLAPSVLNFPFIRSPYKRVNCMRQLWKQYISPTWMSAAPLSQICERLWEREWDSNLTYRVCSLEKKKKNY